MVTSSQIWTHNTDHHWIEVRCLFHFATQTCVQQKILKLNSVFMHHLIFWTRMISGFHRAWFYKGLAILDWQGTADLAELDEHWPPKPVMVSMVSSIPTGDNFVFLMKYIKAHCHWCQYCAEMSDLCCKRKPRIRCVF